MMILAVETSGRTGSVALVVDGKCLVERSLETAGRRHAQTLIGEAHQLMLEHGHRLSDCSAVAVSQGPGSFTGLRVGIVFAKTMAYSTGCKLIAVNTMDCIAQQAPPLPTPDRVGRLHVICDAQRGDVFSNVFALDESGQRRATGPTVIQSSSDWFATVLPTDAISGPGLSRFAELTGQHPHLIAADLRLPTATSLAGLAIQAFNDGQFTDPFELEPFYLRKSAAEEQWEARNQTDATSAKT